MPSLHLDIPSIDWIARPPRGEKPGGGKAASTAEAAQVPTMAAGSGDRSAARNVRDRSIWSGPPAGAMA